MKHVNLQVWTWDSKGVGRLSGVDPPAVVGHWDGMPAIGSSRPTPIRRPMTDPSAARPGARRPETDAAFWSNVLRGGKMERHAKLKLQKKPSDLESLCCQKLLDIYEQREQLDMRASNNPTTL